MFLLIKLLLLYTVLGSKEFNSCLWFIVEALDLFVCKINGKCTDFVQDNKNENYLALVISVFVY